jgi:hypothetical protein
MADLNFSLGSIGISDYLIVRLRLASAPGTVVGTPQVFGPVPPTVQNIIFTGLNPDFYLADVYESVDGVALTNLFNTFEITLAADDQTSSVYKYYVVDRGLPGDPAQDDTSLVDTDLDGKTIASFSQRGSDKLRPETEPDNEWVRTSGGIDLIGGLIFNSGDTYVVEISNKITPAPPASSGPFVVEKTVTSTSSLDATYRNCLINCNGSGAQLVITMEAVFGTPDGTQWLFIDQEGGSQLQTKITFAGSDHIKWRGLSMTEIWIGKGEFLIIKKQGSTFKVVQAHEGLNMVGLRVSAIYKSHPNTLPNDSSRYSADDYPRIWWGITNMMTSDSVFVDNAMTLAGGYTRPILRQGQFIISTTNRVFMMPDSRGLMEKGLANFVTYGGDTANRVIDFPGGFQADALQDHTHSMDASNTGGSYPHGRTPTLQTTARDSGPQTNQKSRLTGKIYNTPAANTDGALLIVSAETRVKNVGVIFCKHV